MSPCLFNIYMDGVIRQLNARILGRRLSLVNTSEWMLNQLFVGDTTLVVGLEEKLCQLLQEFGQVSRRNLRMSGNKSKVMKYRRVGGRRINAALNGKLFEKVDHFKYLGSEIIVDGGMETSEV